MVIVAIWDERIRLPQKRNRLWRHRALNRWSWTTARKSRRIATLQYDIESEAYISI
jgi:hypothetical protein